MNKELQSFAYISSHDLQEPLRKIQTFSTQILETENDNLTESGKDRFRRMQHGAHRMQTLIDDLLTYSRASTEERKFENIDLNKLVQEIREDLIEELTDKHASIEAAELDNANVIPFQFRQLLHNLIGNSLKFSTPEKPPLIKVSSEIISSYPALGGRKACHIKISDNGIGFEKQFSEKIFEVFQRLENEGNNRNEYMRTWLSYIALRNSNMFCAVGSTCGGVDFTLFKTYGQIDKQISAAQTTKRIGQT